MSTNALNPKQSDWISLVSAAPKMLEALYAARDSLEALSQEAPGYAVLPTVLKAIAKAEGK